MAIDGECINLCDHDDRQTDRQTDRPLPPTVLAYVRTWMWPDGNRVASGAHQEWGDSFHIPAVSPAHGSMYVYYDYESQWMHPSPSMMHCTNSLGTNALGVPHLHHHRRHCVLADDPEAVRSSSSSIRAICTLRCPRGCWRCEQERGRNAVTILVVLFRRKIISSSMMCPMARTNDS